MSKIKNWQKGTGSYKISEIDTGTKYLENTSAGTTAIQSKQAYGEWEFDLYKNNTANAITIPFITTLIGGYGGYFGYGLTNWTNEGLYFEKASGSGTSGIFNTANSYLANNTWYRIKVARLSSYGTFASIVPSMTTTYPADTFAVFIKGGSFGDDNWTLVDPTGGSGTNPVTDSTYTTSNYFVADLDAGDRIANLKIKSGVDQ